MEIKIKRLNESDIPSLIKLSQSVEWDYDVAEIQTVLNSGVIYGHKNKQGDLVSSAAILSYGNDLASIGMVIVHKDYRGYGLGKELIRLCLKTVPENMPIMLISTEQGKGLYKSFGFKEVSYVHKYLCENLNHLTNLYTADKRYKIVPYKQDHFPQLAIRSSHSFRNSAFDIKKPPQILI
jgi:predicted GNAT family N-acyltransferase